VKLLIDENLSPALVQQLAGDVDLHPGVIGLRAGHLSREEQWAWMLPVVRRFSGPRADLLNRVVVRELAASREVGQGLAATSQAAGRAQVDRYRNASVAALS